MKIVIDTNVYFSAILFGGLPQLLINKCFENHEVFLSSEIMNEIKNKLIGGRTQEICTKMNKKYNAVAVHQFIIKLECLANFIVPQTQVDFCRDKKDNMILELAQEIEADFIITGDKDLLVLDSFGVTKIVTAAEFILNISSQ
jgi:uncharacterized protein